MRASTCGFKASMRLAALPADVRASPAAATLVGVCARSTRASPPAACRRVRPGPLLCPVSCPEHLHGRKSGRHVRPGPLLCPEHGASRRRWRRSVSGMIAEMVDEVLAELGDLSRQMRIVLREPGFARYDPRREPGFARCDLRREPGFARCDLRREKVPQVPRRRPGGAGDGCDDHDDGPSVAKELHEAILRASRWAPIPLAVHDRTRAGGTATRRRSEATSHRSTIRTSTGLRPEPPLPP